MSAIGGMPQAELSVGLKQLKSEHPLLLEQLEGMYGLTQKIDQERDVEDYFLELIAMVKEFKAALDPHSEREEGVLFPMMGVYIGTTSGPIAVMEYEHDQAKLNIKGFLEKAEGNQTSTEEKKKLAELIQEAYFILTEHFSKEENVLFPMAERMLTDEEKAELYHRIQEIK
ncbi:hemerythrin domain-containing protein [Neobacillus soli]|nr:hemerythrin domain-containing protein [Neobacillus soli]